MRILLIRPKPPKYTIGLKHIIVCEPLELEYVAAGLTDHEVEIYDMVLENNLPAKIRSFKPDVVGTSSYITGVNVVKDICCEVKAFNSEALTVVGGVHATLNPHDFLDPNVDLIVLGDGIHTMRKIVNRFDIGKSFEGLQGVLQYNGERIQQTGSLDLSVNTQDMPMPRRDLTAKYRQQYYYLFHQPVTMMKTMFGCPYKCSFCYHWPLTGGKVYLRSPESIVDELEQIESKDIYIIDDTFFVHVARLKRIRDLIIERKIEKEYIIYSRSDFIVDHPDIVRDWADIGLKTAIVGLESIHDNDLQRFNKKASARQNVEAIKIMQTHRVDIVGSFIVGMDWTRQDFAQLENYIERTKLYYFMIQPFTPYPGTAIFDQYEDEIIVDRKDHDVWDLQHAILPTHLPKREFYRRIRQIYIRKALNPLRARKLRLRPVPPLWSKKFLRLIWGTIKVYFDWLGAHKHADILARKRLALLPPASKNSTQRIFSRSR